MTVDDAALLHRIGVRRPDRPSAEVLFRIHAAYVETVPYESVQFQLGGKAPLDPGGVARRIVDREAGGYCYQLNGVLAALLSQLGYQVTLHRGGVHNQGGAAAVNGNHLVVTVTGLPEAPDDVWLVDAGLGDGLHVPLPLRPGTYEQEPFSFGLRPSEVAEAGWRLDHDPRASVVGMDFDGAATSLAEFSESHDYLSTSPESPFVRVSTAFRRTPSTVQILRSLTLSTVRRDRTDATVLETAEDWYAALDDVFGLPYAHLTADQRDQLWRRTVDQYEAFLVRTASPG